MESRRVLLRASAMGPFYCTSDQGIYLDTSFFDELQNRFGAKGDFAQNYVIAHEFRHHIQNLLGTSSQVQQQKARSSRAQEIGRAHVWTPVTNAQLVCRLLLEKKKK